MLLSAVSVLVVAQSSSEIPEGLMNNPVYYTVRFVISWLDVQACGNVRQCICYWCCVSHSYYSRDISPILHCTYLSSPDVSDCRPLCILLDYYIIILFNLVEFSSVQYLCIQRSGSRAQMQIIKPAQIFIITLVTKVSKLSFSWFKTFALFWMLYAFFWVIPGSLNVIFRRFGTLCLFHLHRQVGVGWLGTYTYLPMKMEQTECSETLAYNIHMPVNYPEESIQNYLLSASGNAGIITASLHWLM